MNQGLIEDMMENDAKTLLEQMFYAAVQAAQPAVVVPPFVRNIQAQRLIVLGAGKASAAMAQAVEAHFEGDLSGLVVTRYGYAAPCTKIEIVEAAHPVPDAAGMAAAERMLSLAEGLTAKNHVLCLISGGGSALLPLPVAGMTLLAKQDINRALLRAGATIGEMNILRRHLSRIKGGRLAAACYPATVTNLLISDVPGDHPADIASGPFVGDVSTVQDAHKILQKYNIAIDPAQLSESIKPDDLRLQSVTTHLVARPALSLAAAANIAAEKNIPVHMLGDHLEGEARMLGAEHAALALHVAAGAHPVFKPPCILLSGGETTVTVTGNGCGGRNVEYALSLAKALAGQEKIYALAADTDGVDGMADIAGAFVTPTTLARGAALGRDVTAALADNDGHGYFGALGDSLVSGPTQTNVNDVRAIFIL